VTFFEKSAWFSLICKGTLILLSKMSYSHLFLFSHQFLNWKNLKFKSWIELIILTYLFFIYCNFVHIATGTWNHEN
jgi:hypothetical protein